MDTAHQGIYSKLYEYVFFNPECSTKELAQAFNMTRLEIKEIIAELFKGNLLKRGEKGWVVQGWYDNYA